MRSVDNAAQTAFATIVVRIYNEIIHPLSTEDELKPSFGLLGNNSGPQGVPLAGCLTQGRAKNRDADKMSFSETLNLRLKCADKAAASVTVRTIESCYVVQLLSNFLGLSWHFVQHCRSTSAAPPMKDFIDTLGGQFSPRSKQSTYSSQMQTEHRKSVPLRNLK